MVLPFIFYFSIHEPVYHARIKRYGDGAALFAIIPNARQ
jgi:hypothetical protein